MSLKSLWKNSKKAHLLLLVNCLSLSMNVIARNLASCIK